MLTRSRITRLGALGAALAVAISVAPALASTATGPAGHAVGVAEPGAAAQRLAFGDFFPPTPYTQLLRQPDGRTFAAKLTPAEVGGAFETSDGYTVVRGSDQVWRYATGRAADGTLTPSVAVVGRDAVPAGVAAHAGRTRNVWSDAEGRDIRSQLLRQLQIASRKAQRQAAAAGEPRVFRFPALMLATYWDKDKGDTGPTFEKGHDKAYFQKILDGFGGNPRGSLTEFYYEDSFGQFLVQVDVYGPYTSYRSMQDPCYYGGVEPPADMFDDLDPIDSELGVGGGGALGMALEAVPQADPDVDFSRYDNDGDGKVDFTAIIHSGADMAATGNPCYTWSHALSVTFLQPGLPGGIPTSDGVFVDRLFTMPEKESEVDPLTIGVAAHEMGHALGEPDYYDTNYTSSGTGDWDIMSGGSYMGNPSGSNPSGFNPATRVFQGWVTPTLVKEPRAHIALAPRNVKPSPDYTVGKPDPNLLLVPVTEIGVGETDKYGHAWTVDDVYGLARDAVTGRYVVEGYYLENFNRVVNGKPTTPKMSRAPYFDRKNHGSGLMAWHFDYYRRSNTYTGGNDAQSDPNRPQMDPMEFDRNDATQDIQLNYSRGNLDDLATTAATGITSGTRHVQPGLPTTSGPAQKPIEISGFDPPAQNSDTAFTVERNPNNYQMTATVTGVGDCKLQLLHDGKPVGGFSDSGGPGAPETQIVQRPAPGAWTFRVGDFAACTSYTGSVTFGGVGFQTKGSADTWSNWTHQPTGWAFTNIDAGLVDGADAGDEAGGSETITLDVARVASTQTDVSPGFVTPTATPNAGTNPVSAGTDNRLVVPIFNNGGRPAHDTLVEVHRGTASGPLVARTTVDVPGYTRVPVPFTFRSAAEGPQRLVVTVAPVRFDDAVTSNNVQATDVWVGPADPRVLVVDDDALLDSETAVTGALAALGVPYAVAGEHPDAALLKRYPAVIWETGQERNQGQLTAQDRTALRSYLDGGGKLLLTASRATDALGQVVSSTTPDASPDAQDFLRYYLGAETVDVKTVEQPEKITGHGWLKGVAGSIEPFAVRPFDDTMRPAKYGDAPVNGHPDTAYGMVTPLLDLTHTAADEWIGVGLDADAKHHGFKTVLLGINLAQASNLDTAVGVVRATLRHFGIPTGTWRPRADVPVVYAPAVRDQVSGRDTPVRAIVTGGASDVALHYRHHGKGRYVTAPMRPGKVAGSYVGTIPGRDVTPDGVDYYVTATRGGVTTYDPPLASTGRLAHGIGVSLPEVGRPAPKPAPDAAPASTATLPLGGSPPAGAGALTGPGYVPTSAVAAQLTGDDRPGAGLAGVAAALVVGTALAWRRVAWGPRPSRGARR